MESGIFGMYFKAGVSEDAIQDAINNFYLDNKEIIDSGYYYGFIGKEPADEIKQKAESYKDDKLTKMKKPTVIEIGVKAFDDAGVEKEFCFGTMDELKIWWENPYNRKICWKCKGLLPEGTQILICPKCEDEDVKPIKGIQTQIGASKKELKEELR